MDSSISLSQEAEERPWMTSKQMVGKNRRG